MMLQRERKIEEILEQLNQDKLLIDDRSEERQKKYQEATKQFLKSIKREMKTIDDTKEQHRSRNDKFYNQTKDVYQRYQSRSIALINSNRKTTKAKIEFNNSLLHYYPEFLKDQKQNLYDDVQQLQNRLKELQILNQKENYDYHKIMAKKFEGISEDVSAQRKQLESELNETRKLLQQQPIIENDDNLLEEVEKKYAKQKEMISTGTLQKNKELQQLNYEKNTQQPQPQYLIKNQNDLEGLQNLEKYAGLKSDQFQTKQRQEAKKLLEDFMQPAPRQHFKKFIPRTEGMQAPNYHQFDSLGNNQQNNQMQYPYRLDNFTLSQPQGSFIKQEQKQFVISRNNSQQTFPESVDQQSSNNRVEDITLRNRGARQE